MVVAKKLSKSNRQDLGGGARLPIGGGGGAKIKLFHPPSPDFPATIRLLS